MWSYSVTGVWDGSGNLYGSREDATEACMEFLECGVELPGGVDRLFPKDFEEWMVLNRTG